MTEKPAVDVPNGASGTSETAPQTSERANFLVERRSIDFIPAHLRHGKPSDLMFVWFGANMELPVIAAGATTVAGGLGLGWAALAIVIGVGVGSLLMAYHSAQGPHLGLPQMIQSRAQFGYYGAAVPLVFVIVMYLGFYAAGAVLGGQALSRLTGLPLSGCVIVLSVLSLLVATFGYNLIHKVEKYLSMFVAVVFVVLTIAFLVAPHHAGAAATGGGGGFKLGAFLLAISVTATSQLLFAPYVADYSRYLPESTSIKSVFWYTYGGVGFSGVWLMILGASLMSFDGRGPVDAIGSVAGSVGGWFAKVTYLALILGVLTINALNIYGGYMSSLSLANTFFRKLRSGLGLRLCFIIPVSALATYMSFLYMDNLLDAFENFLVFALALMIPWTAVNLVDYYFVRRGSYSVPDMFTPRGVYGRVSPAGATAYVAGFVVQMPFMQNDVIQGPVAKMLHGGDVSWIVGAVVSGLLYLLIMRKRGVGAEVSAG
ncbi:MAG TPA: cytosine permease [Streptosporangiaceae bacterium]